LSYASLVLNLPFERRRNDNRFASITAAIEINERLCPSFEYESSALKANDGKRVLSPTRKRVFKAL